MVPQEVGAGAAITVSGYVCVPTNRHTVGTHSGLVALSAGLSDVVGARLIGKAETLLRTKGRGEVRRWRERVVVCGE